MKNIHASNFGHCVVLTIAQFDVASSKTHGEAKWADTTKHCAFFVCQEAAADVISLTTNPMLHNMNMHSVRIVPTIYNRVIFLFSIHNTSATLVDKLRTRVRAGHLFRKAEHEFRCNTEATTFVRHLRKCKPS